MGWLFTAGSNRKQLIAERTDNWAREGAGGITVTTVCLAHCYRGGAFSGVLWAVWERTFAKDGQPTQPVERWITCDLLRHRKDFGWGYKDLEESMHPYFYSCPLGYLDMVPMGQYGGNVEWRSGVQAYHARQQINRRRTPTEIS
ncbi:MAG: hypothetical protein ACYC0X_23475 [Pirellulaceae bacterium]